MGLLQDFLGKSQQEDLARAKAESASFLNQALGDYTTTQKDYLGQALGQFNGLQPFVDSGTGSIRLLSDALGVNGAGPQSAFYNSFQTDPGFMASQQAGIDALDKSAASRGLLRSGGQQRDLFSFGQRFLSDAFNNRINQLFGLGQQGGQIGMGVAGAKSGLLSGTGSDIANAQLGVGQLMANNATNYGNAMAQSRGIGINNILGVGNLLANAFKPAPTFNFGGGNPGISGGMFPNTGFALPGQRA